MQYEDQKIRQQQFNVPVKVSNYIHISYDQLMYNQQMVQYSLILFHSSVFKRSIAQQAIQRTRSFSLNCCALMLGKAQGFEYCIVRFYYCTLKKSTISRYRENMHALILEIQSSFKNAHLSSLFLVITSNLPLGRRLL